MTIHSDYQRAAIQWIEKMPPNDQFIVIHAKIVGGKLETTCGGKYDSAVAIFAACTLMEAVSGAAPPNHEIQIKIRAARDALLGPFDGEATE